MVDEKNDEGENMRITRKYWTVIFAVGVTAGMSSAALSHDSDEASHAKGKHGVYSGTVHGVISDSMCKFDHSAMIKAGHGADAKSCTEKCVKEGNKLVLADKKNKIVYTFVNAKEVKSYAGKQVAITGHIDPDTKVIHIHSVKAE